MGRRLGALVVVAVALAGCGGNDSSSQKSQRKPAAASARAPKPIKQSRTALRAATLLPTARPGAPPPPRGVAPQPVESLSDALDANKAAAASGDCDKILPLRHSAERPSGVGLGGAPTAQECDSFKAGALSQVQGAVPVDSERFGPVAVVDYDRNGQQVTGLWIVEPDGHWRFAINGQFLTHSVGSHPARPDLYDEGVNGFLGAAQNKDCAAGFRFLNPDSVFQSVAGTKDQWCSFVTPLYDVKYNFFQGAAGDTSAKPRPLGANRLYGFYELEFNNRTSWILVGKVTPSNIPADQAQGHVENGFQSMYSGSFAPS